MLVLSNLDIKIVSKWGAYRSEMLQEQPRMASVDLKGVQNVSRKLEDPLGGTNVVPSGPKMANKLLQDAPR